MKRIILLTVILAFAASPSFADGLRAELESCCNASLSANVIGYYWSNSTSDTATDASKFVITTANTNGDKIYAGASNLAAIYVKSASASPIQSSELINSKPSNFDSDMVSDVLSGYSAQ